MLDEEEKIVYLANLLSVARADGSISPNEMQAIEAAQKRIGARKTLLRKAEGLVEAKQYSPAPVGSLSAKVSNIEDMVSVSFADGALDDKEKPVVLAFAQKVGVTNNQLKQIVGHARATIALARGTRACPACATDAPLEAKFCPKCGGSLAKSDQEAAVAVAYEVPADGVAIEFAESTASGFADAVQRAQGAPVQATCVKGKKTWYLAAWPKSEISEAATLASDLKGMRNRKVWLDGEESRWDDVFSFLWCSDRRETAYRPVEYCFGVDEKRLNIWGCKQARLEWSGWSGWFNYGNFKRPGVLRGHDTFVFDKGRIRHDLETNLFRFRLCPHLNFRLVEAVLAALPDEVEIRPNGDWEYKRDHEESPGAIRITTSVVEGGFTYTDEYFSSGVQPRSSTVGLRILEKALAACGDHSGALKAILAYRES